MFRLRLRPTPAGFAVGIAMIAFWALLWLWFLAQLAQPVATARVRPLGLTAADAVASLRPA